MLSIHWGQLDNWLILGVFARERVDYTVQFKTAVRPCVSGRLKIA